MKALMNNQAINQTGAHRSSAFGNSYLFSGRRFNDRVGIYYYQNRYFEATVGRFISRDPLRYIDGLNCYTYTNNNPINFKDSFGTEIIPGDGKDNGCDGFVYVSSEIKDKTKQKARRKTVLELRKEETLVRKYAIQQCINAGKKSGKRCILQGDMITSGKSTYRKHETNASRKNRKGDGNDPNCITGVTITATTRARIKCRNVDQLREQIEIDNNYVNQDLENIKYEEDKRKKVRNISEKLLIVAVGIGLLKRAWIGGAGLRLGARGSALVGLSIP